MEERNVTQNYLVVTQVLLQLKFQACQNCFTKLLSNFLSADVPQTASTAEI